MQAPRALLRGLGPRSRSARCTPTVHAHCTRAVHMLSICCAYAVHALYVHALCMCCACAVLHSTCMHSLVQATQSGCDRSGRQFDMVVAALFRVLGYGATLPP